jgi:predicted dehydrogenase
MSERVRVASVGLGWWGKELAAAAGRSGELEIVSCFARTPESRRAFAQAEGCREAADLTELLADDEVEGLLVATTHASHRELIEAAAAAGRHVFVEKPLTLSVDDGRAAVDAAARAGIVLQVGHQRRRLPAHRAIRALLDDGSLGDIEMLEANHSLPNGFSLPDEAWRRNPGQSPLGSMTSLGIHQIDNFHYLAGRVAGVSAVARPGRDAVTAAGSEGGVIDEAAALLFDFESGAVGTLLTSFFTPWNIRLAVHGTEGAAFADDDGSRLEVQRRGERQREPRALEEVDTVADQLVEFAAAVRGERTPEVGGEEALEVIAVMEAAVESVRRGQRVELADVRR